MKVSDITTEQEIDARLLKVKLKKELNPVSYDHIAYLIDWSIIVSTVLIIVGNIVSSSVTGTASDALAFVVIILVYYWFLMVVSTTVRRIIRYRKAARS